MVQKIFLSGFMLLALGGPLSAMDEIDNFITTRCGSDCNGPTNTSCRDCLSRGVDLFDQPRSMAIHDLDINPRGGFEIRF